MLPYLAKLILERREHYRLFSGLTKRCLTLRFIFAAECDHVAPDISVLPMRYRAADRAHVACNAAFDRNIASDGEHAFNSLFYDERFAERGTFNVQILLDDHPFHVLQRSA